MQKLFMIYLGGSAPNAHLELHDVQFVIAPSIEETYQTLRQRWFGNRKGLHVDSYKQIIGADGYAVHISEKSQDSDLRLYFVNIGGYDKRQMAELHEFGLFVGVSPEEVKAKAKQTLLQGHAHLHKDNLVAVDSCLEITLLDNYYIHLSKTNHTYDLIPDWYGYHVIG